MESTTTPRKCNLFCFRERSTRYSGQRGNAVSKHSLSPSNISGRSILRQSVSQSSPYLSQHPDQTERRIRKRLSETATAALSILIYVFLLPGCSQGPSEPNVTQSSESNKNSAEALSQPAISLDQIKTQIAQGNRSGAKKNLRSYLLQNPTDGQALEIAGDLASAQSSVDEAIDQYRMAVEVTENPSEPLLNKLAMEQMKGNRAMESMETLVKRVDKFPNELQARYDLIGLSAMLGFPELAVPSLRWLTQQGKTDPDILQVLADPQRVQADAELCNKMLQRYPEDQRLQYAIARIDASELRWQEVAEKLEIVLDQHPNFLAAHCLYGRALVELNRFDEIAKWHQKIPAGAESSPSYWLIAGAWAEHLQRYPEAAKCYWRGVKIDLEGHPELLPRLARSLRQIGQENDAKIVDDQIAKRAALRDALTTHFVREASSQQAAMQVAKALMSMGRTWEAEGWARLATTLRQNPLSNLRDQYLAIRNQLSVESPWQDPKRALSNQIDLSELPSLQWDNQGQNQKSKLPQRIAQLGFVDEAGQRSWNHTCEVAPEALTEGHWIYQSMGGGVAVVDYDLDGWPDLAAAMLDGTPLKTDSSPNRLFRNLDGNFTETTSPANYLDTGFGQGLTVGDFNEDGLPDLFDANIGQNRLYRNNGDGTFTEIAGEAGLSGAAWTTSATIADFDGDGIADLFETAYCGGSEPYEVPCKNQQGLYSTCTPLNFQAELDRVWKGTGDGTFTDASNQWLNQSAPGRGMGLQVGYLDNQEGLDIYVSNDMTVNHLWSGQVSPEGFTLTDVASVRGVAVSGRSFSQASMGIAAGDPDADGDVDLFVTHFADDHNTFYEQVGNGLWVDRSFQVGLGDPSIKQLGFGTEWIDCDNNGTQELIITNGHVDDVETKEIAYHMQPQLFELDQAGRWALIPNQDLGNYFESEHLGRALVTLDADRDGLSDVAITHLYAPATLLMNRSQNTGRSITLKLIATASQRDAIGTKVSVNVEGRQIHHQLFAGDGYMCSNQRHLQIGIAEQSEVESIQIMWPSGYTESIGPIAAGTEVTIVEGEGSPFIIRAH